MVRGGARGAPLSDAVDSTRLTVDDAGTPVGTNEWDAWSNQRSFTGTEYGFGWTGQQHDASSDLIYLRARSYSPARPIAQFLIAFCQPCTRDSTASVTNSLPGLESEAGGGAGGGVPGGGAGGALG